MFNILYNNNNNNKTNNNNNNKTGDEKKNMYITLKLHTVCTRCKKSRRDR